MKSDQIRKAFIDFFVEREHKAVASSPLVPPDDPSLLFTTAGMVQFKSLYAGYGELPYRRACTVQKCMRAGGKGSDLENVGRTLRHHTFFEMLGNFSFGDYFKRDALLWAWEFSTKAVQLNADRIYASVYEDDDEAWDIWTKEIGLPASRMVRLGVKDNFWGPAGETGACGPCSELYYDRGEKYGEGLTFQHATTNDDDPGSRYLEFWNCVFPQFDQQKDGSRPLLKNRGVDTGMGLERLCCLKQDKETLYQTDLMYPIVERACQLMHIQSYEAAPQELRQAVNVVADHVRALTFVLSEGILPSNEGRGYVMRRLLRRASRYARKAGMEQPFLYEIVDTVIDTMAPAYPEIREGASIVKRVIRVEEESFGNTLGDALKRLDALLPTSTLVAIPDDKKVLAALSGSDIFQLTATFGLPLDDILEIARDRGVDAELESYHQHVEAHKVESRKGAKGAKFEGIYERLKEIAAEHGKTIFLGYPMDEDEMEAELENWIADEEDEENLLGSAEARVSDLGLDKTDAKGRNYRDAFLAEHEEAYDDDELTDGYPVAYAEELEVLALFRGDESVARARVGDQVAVVLEASPFYAESGGQVGDTGTIRTDEAVVRVNDTQKTAEDVFVHYGVVELGELHVGDSIIAEIDVERRLSIMRNHTATHLLQGALKRVVGKHVTQQGSYVGPDYLRFDFSNPEAVTSEQVSEIERLVNHQAMRDAAVITSVLPLEEARKLPGIIAPFGEKYGGTVRVVEVPEWDIEFCGGTHLLATGSIGPFLITSESAVASGVRRIEAVTGAGAVSIIQKERSALKRVSEELRVPREKVGERLSALMEEIKTAKRQLSQLQAKSSSGDAESLLEKAIEASGVKVVTHHNDSGDAKSLRDLYDAMKSRRPHNLVAILGAGGDKVTIIAGVTNDVVKRGISAGDIVKLAAPIVGGSGGGKPEMAQAGGKDADKLQEALDSARKAVLAKLGS
ncbi:MAG: alanine--tRNA ligase [Candidatus Sumerlaeaceae bacterium]